MTSELYIPPLWQEDWEGAFENAQGVKKELIHTQGKAAYLLKRVTDKEATPQRLAWLILWTRVFLTLDGVRGALPHISSYTLSLLARGIMETELTLLAILEPYKSQPADLARDAMFSRMAAYAAWCLWNDYQRYERMLDRRNMDAAWDDTPGRNIAEDPHQRTLYERLHGPLEMEDPDELRRRRRKQEENLWADQQRIKAYLDDPDLSKWFDELADRKKRRRYASSFFDLIDTDETSVMRRLIAHNIGFAYPIYQKLSTILHGSTFDQIIGDARGEFVPLFCGAVEESNELAERIDTVCKSVLLNLALVANELWEKPV